MGETFETWIEFQTFKKWYLYIVYCHEIKVVNLTYIFNTRTMLLLLLLLKHLVAITYLYRSRFIYQRRYLGIRGALLKQTKVIVCPGTTSHHFNLRYLTVVFIMIQLFTSDRIESRKYSYVFGKQKLLLNRNPDAFNTIEILNSF